MRLLRILVMSVVLLLPTMAALAQTKGGAVIELEGGYTVTLPEGWRSDEVDGDGRLFVNRDSSILFFDPVLMEDYVPARNRDDVGEALLAAYERYLDDVIPENDLEFETFAGYSAALWYFDIEDDGLEGAFIVVEIEAETFVALDIVTPVGDRADALEAAEDIVASLTTEGAAASGTGTVGTALSSGEPCVVSTDAANSVSLRVGPGPNRGAIAFLPAGVEFTVIGAATASDGSEWFKLDKAEAAPSTAASEIWVARDDVEESGDCDTVVDVAAPPVVPITNNPPPASPQPGTGSTSSTSTTTTTTSGGITPRSGTWTINLAAQSNASCQGSSNVSFPSAEVYGSLMTFRVPLSASGPNILVEGVPYRPTGAPNEYVGTFADGASNGQLYIVFTSETTFTGSITGNLTVNGVACSATTALSGRFG